MSIKAMNWAMEQATGDPRSQCLLYVIADCANPDGMAFPSIKYMASKSQQSKATVQRRLKELEVIGALARFPRWEDENGKINSEGRGRRTSDEIRLLIEARIERASPVDDGEESGTPPYQADTPPVAVSDPPVSQLSDGGPSHCSDPYMNRKKEPKKVDPPAPQGGRVADEANVEGDVWPGSDTWPEFKTAWREPMPRESIARQVWSALTDAERKLAITAASGLHVWRGEQKRPPTMQSAPTFLRERDAWADFAKHAPPAAGVIAGSFVPIHTEIGRALVALNLVAGNPSAGVQTSNGRAIRASKDVPPRVMALAVSVDIEGRRDEAKWPMIEVGTQQFGAWCNFVGDELGVMPRIEDVIVGRIMKDEIDPVSGETTGKQVFDRVDRRRGFRAPSEWPPRVDGTLSSTAPLGTISDEDARELARN